MHYLPVSSLNIPIENINLQNLLFLDLANREVDYDRVNILADFLRPKDIEKKNTLLFLAYPKHLLLLEAQHNPEIRFYLLEVWEILQNSLKAQLQHLRRWSDRFYKALSLIHI